MEKPNKQPILVIGGGIGGMCTALALAKRGFHTLVIEKSPEKSQRGTGLIFCPNTFKVFEYLGLAQAFKKIAYFPKEHLYIDAYTGFNYLTIPFREPFEKIYHQPFASYLHDEALDFLLAECEKTPLISLIFNAKIVEVGEGEEGVYAKAKDGTTYTGEALIGADGLWSQVRKYLLNDGPPRNNNIIVYRDVMSKDTMPDEYCFDTMHTLAMKKAHLVCYPIGTKDQFNISAIFQTENTPEIQEYRGNREKLFSAFEGAVPFVMKILERMDINRIWILFDRPPVKNWSRGKIALLGDAAHPTLPAMASGAGMAIEDAYAIAQKIAAYPGEYATAFKLYVKERYLRTAYVQQFSRIITYLHHASGIERELENTLLPKVSTEQIYDAYSYLYRGIDIASH